MRISDWSSTCALPIYSRLYVVDKVPTNFCVIGMREPAADPTVWMRPPPPSVAGALKMALSYLSNVACRISNPAFTVSCDEGRAVKSTSMPYKVDLEAFAITGLEIGRAHV